MTIGTIKNWLGIFFKNKTLLRRCQRHHTYPYMANIAGFGTASLMPALMGGQLDPWHSCSFAPGLLWACPGDRCTNMHQGVSICALS